MDEQKIAEAFSNGKFELTYPYLDDHIEWNVVGESILNGKREVMQQCEKTSGYFQSVTTDFKTLNVIVAKNRVAINGTAAFYKNDKLLAFVSACDVYEFNENKQLQKITSYCIPLNKEQENGTDEFLND